MNHTVQVRKEKIFFPNLDGLRFFSFFSVYVFHIFLLLFDKYHRSGWSYGLVRFLFQNGEIGVNFFFVLSGFLITYLLVEEKRFTGKIHIGKFYVRRILRIWPLFYLVVLVGFLVYPIVKGQMGAELFQAAHPVMYLVFLNNFDFLKNGAPAFISILWSVAIEEQFYLMWPVVLFIIPVNRYKWLFFGVILLTLLFRMLHHSETRVLQFHSLAVIGDMALGGLLAYYSIFSDAFRNKIRQLPRALISLVYLLALLIFLFRQNLFAGYMMVFERIFIGIIFGIIILEQNFSDHSLFKMSQFKRISKLGIYTYGLYCLHVLSLNLAEMGFVKLGFDMKKASTYGFIGITGLVFSIVLALLSYYLYESKFLQLKNKFAFIVR
jgi:peptidoglycan/LPS O-acetylase OafA/YrhL